VGVAATDDHGVERSGAAMAQRVADHVARRVVTSPGALERHLDEAPFVVFSDNERGPLTAR
jgi:hypothetical protein